jgi:hypothetical protein
MLLSALVAAKPASATYTGPLDIVSGAVVAYGQRALSAAQRGSALYTIRRDSDDTTHTYNSDATTGAAPAAAISSFIGGGSGFVATWTDQSGNGSDVSQATAANQPQWASNVANSRPAFAFDGVSRYLATSGNIDITNAGTGDIVAFIVGVSIDNNGNISGQNAATGAGGQITLTAGAFSGGWTGTANVTGASPNFDGPDYVTNGAQTGDPTVPFVWDAAISVSSGDMYLNGVAGSLNSIGTGNTHPAASAFRS